MKNDEFWPGVERLLNIKTADAIDTAAFKELQHQVFEQLKTNGTFDKYSPEYARLAVGNGTSSIKFCKYSV